MAEKSKPKKESTTGTAPLNEMAETARKNYEHAVRTGQRMQEEAGQWWSRMLGQAGTTGDWQTQISSMTQFASRVMPLAQRRFEDALDLMQKNSKASADLMKLALEAAQTPGLAESQARWVDVWTSGMKAVQGNVEAVTHISTKAIDSWLDFVRKSGLASEHHAAASA
ncbi:MAG TPA: hypothetical protein VG167_16905 [Verrucomicrobiae bacterium]|nr:hypothetical protein [Verrucomicrobiae bacterium]